MNSVINMWEAQAVLTSEEANKLRKNIEILPFDWKRLAMYSFWISILCLMMAVGAVAADQFLMQMLQKIFHAPNSIKSFVLACASAVMFIFGVRIRAKHPGKAIGSDSLFLLGSLCVAGSIVYLGKAVLTGSGDFPLLILLAALIYGTLAISFRSTLLWMLTLLSFSAWFGTQTGYASGWNAYFLGMNYLMRFVFFGTAVLGLSMILKKFRRCSLFVEITYGIALFCIFGSLWLLSIFGNYVDLAAWSQISQFTLVHWSIVLGVAAILCALFGLKNDDSVARGFGIVFFFLDLYTGYFAYLWNSAHKAVFFFILAVSFWLVGIKAEKIWTFDFIKPKNHRS